MEKMKMESADLPTANIKKIALLFPEVITETWDVHGNLKKAINFDLLKQLLANDLVEDEEVYEFTWNGKKKSILEAGRPIRKTLRPYPEESKNWDTTENLYIEGDNLDILKLLQESYLGKVKMIYIDPPYNTGNEFIYKDSWAIDSKEWNNRSGVYDLTGAKLIKNSHINGRFHTDWLSMIYPRLKIARNLLTDDGAICISIDDNEFKNLQKICDEIFGENNLINIFIWNCSTAGGIRPKFASKTHEYILCYAKDLINLPPLYSPLSAAAKKMYTQRDARGLYRDKDFIFKNKSTNPNQGYIITCPDGEKVKPKPGYIYRFVQETFKNALANDLVTFKKTATGPLITENGSQAHWNIYIKKYLGNATGAPATLIPAEMAGIYNTGTQCVQTLFDGNRVFENVKPLNLIEYFVKMLTSKESIILDFFSGSATTAHAVMRLNAEDGGKRTFIMVQLQEPCPEKSEAYKAGYSNICEIGKERIRRAGEKIREVEQAKLAGHIPDTGFRVFKLADSNMKDVYYGAKEYAQGTLTELVSNIREDRNELDLLYGCVLDLGLELSLPHKREDINGTSVYFYNGAELAACFAPNISEETIREIAKRHPRRVVFRDHVFAGSPAKINAAEIFKALSPHTSIKVL